MIIVAIMVINVALAFAVASYGRSKGFPYAPILVAAIFVSVPLTWLIVALMPPRSSRY